MESVKIIQMVYIFLEGVETIFTSIQDWGYKPVPSFLGNLFNPRGDREEIEKNTPTTCKNMSKIIIFQVCQSMGKGVKVLLSKFRVVYTIISFSGRVGHIICCIFLQEESLFAAEVQPSTIWVFLTPSFIFIKLQDSGYYLFSIIFFQVAHKISDYKDLYFWQSQSSWGWSGVWQGGVNQGGIKYFTSWEPILSAENFARNSGSQTRQERSKQR